MIMTDQNIQEQISELNRKMDLVLESVELQKRSREEINDLVKDVNIVAKDAFQQTVVMLDKAQVEFDSDALSSLVIKILQNIGTFHEMLELLESARDFMKDVSPILHQVGLDAVTRMNELDRKGYFIFAADVLNLMDRFVVATSKVKMDDKLDNKSLFGILKELNSPEVRKSLSYSLRLLKEINKS
jgi:uncharacterized protein YjgD (DUF1641 family)